MNKVLYGNEFTSSLYEEIKNLVRGEETDLMINEDGKVWVQDGNGEIKLIKEDFDNKKILSLGSLLASHYDLALNGTHPFLDCQIPYDGARIHINIPPSSDSPTLSLRFHKTSFRNLDTLRETGMFSKEQQALLIKFVREKKNIIINGETGCHSKGTLILMANGDLKEVEDIQTGDFVMGDDGTKRKVLELHRGQDKMYMIEPVKGDAFIVNSSHILHLIRTDLTGWRNYPPFIDISVKEYITKSNLFKHHYKLYKGKVDSFENTEELKIPPYVLGCILGDGHIEENDLSITSPDTPILTEFARWLKTINCTCRYKINDQTSCPTLIAQSKGKSHNLFMQYIRELGLANKKAGDKFIPFVYKTSSFENRLKLLAGLLDTDGNLSNKTCFDYISKSRQLAEDIVFISRSVGLRANVKECIKGYQNFKGTYYRVSISGETSIIPNKVERKKNNKIRKQIKRANTTGFKVKELGLGDYYGFTLDGNHLYMDGQFFIHHNSGKSTLLSALLNEIDPRERIITIEDTKELTCTLPNITHLYTYDRNVFSDVDAVRGALRMNPSRIIYGEVRDGRATLELIKAWNTGHKGGLCTIHANTRENDYIGGVRTRLISLTNEVSSTAQTEAIDEVLEVIIQIEIRDGKRQIVNIENVKG